MTPHEALDKAGEALQKAEQVLGEAATAVSATGKHEPYIQLAKRWMLFADTLRKHQLPAMPSMYKADWPYPGTATPSPATQPPPVTVATGTGTFTVPPR